MAAGEILKSPRITEKGSMLLSKNAYVFNISDSAGRKEVREAVFELYKVKPVKVNILKVPKKKITSRGKIGERRGGRKAVVYLKSGDKIEFV
jgi:large subunit ribosomal protein L23